MNKFMFTIPSTTGAIMTTQSELTNNSRNLLQLDWSVFHNIPIKIRNRPPNNHLQSLMGS